MRELMIETQRAAAGTLAVNSPYDGRVLERVATSGTEHVEDALTAAYALFRNRDAWLPVPQRLAILQKTAEIMQSRVEELTIVAASEARITSDFGKAPTGRSTWPAYLTHPRGFLRICPPSPFASCLDDATASTRHSASGLNEHLSQETPCRSGRDSSLPSTRGRASPCGRGRPHV